MDPHTRQQLLQLSTDFYRAHATGFDASRGHQPWPGWQRLLESLPNPEEMTRPLSVLDVGCGNARLATFLANAGQPLRYVGVDANAALLDAARERLPPDLATQVELVEADFLATRSPGSELPQGPFDFVALFGVLHHVPGQDWRTLLFRELVRRTTPGGVIAVAAWQFLGRERFDRKGVAWEDIGPTLGHSIDPAHLEAGDVLLRFGSNPKMPPRYCHQVADAELDAIDAPFPAASGEGSSELDDTAGPTHDIVVDPLDDYRADGSEGDLNRYRVLQRRL
jgi:SAM-dependent methyltransferase